MFVRYMPRHASINPHRKHQFCGDEPQMAGEDNKRARQVVQRNSGLFRSPLFADQIYQKQGLVEDWDEAGSIEMESSDV